MFHSLLDGINSFKVALFSCFGYSLIKGLLIVDAGRNGWRGADIDDVLGIVGIECESYWYLNPLTARIIK